MHYKTKGLTKKATPNEVAFFVLYQSYNKKDYLTEN